MDVRWEASGFSIAGVNNLKRTSKYTNYTKIQEMLKGKIYIKMLTNIYTYTNIQKQILCLLYIFK